MERNGRPGSGPEYGGDETVDEYGAAKSKQNEYGQPIGAAAEVGKRTTTALIARDARPGARTPNRVPAAVRHALATESGAPLPEPERWSRELGVDVGDARVVTGASAHAAAESIDARAFTLGERVFFGAGEYAPETPSGQSLLRHELTHVAQQRGAAIPAHDQLGISSPSEGIEHEARAHEAGAGHGAAAGGAAVIARRDKATPLPDYPGTAGGLRLGRTLDPLSDKDRVARIRTQIWNVQITNIDNDYYTATGKESQGAFADAYLSFHSTRQAIQSTLARDVARQEALLAKLLDDLAVLGAEQFRAPALDKKKLADSVERVLATYTRLADLWRDRRTAPVTTDVDQNRGKENDFRDRADLFVDYSRQQLGEQSAQHDRVLEGTASDTDRFAKEAGARPVATGQLLVYELLGDQANNVAPLRELFRRVIDEVSRRVTPAVASFLRTAFDIFFDQLVLAPIRAAAQNQAADKTKLNQVRLGASRHIGEFLARVDAANAHELTWKFFPALGAALLPYGLGNWTFPIPELEADEERVVKERETMEREERERKEREAHERKEREQKDRERAETERKERERKEREERERPRHVCRVVQGYGLADIAAWLRSYFTAPAEFNKKTFSIMDLACAVAPNAHNEPPDVAAANLTEWRAMCVRLLGAIGKHYRQAQGRDREIDALRLKLKMQPPAGTTPDYVEVFGLASVYSFLVHLPWQTSDFDASGYEGQILPLAMAHFLELTTYQRALLGALKLIERSGKARDHVARHHAKDPGGTQLAELLELAATAPDWPSSEEELAKAGAISLRVQQVELVLGAADVDLKAARRGEIEQQIHAALPPILERIWTKAEGTQNPRDRVHAGEIWPELKGLFPDKQDALVARDVLDAAIEEVNVGRLEALARTGGAAAIAGDTVMAEKLARRTKGLGALIHDHSQDASADALIKWVQGQTTNLIAIFTMAQGALGIGGERPGDIVRAANLIRIAMARGGGATLTSAYEYIDAHDVELALVIQEEARSAPQGPLGKMFLEGSKREAMDDLKTGRIGVNYMVGSAVFLLRGSAKGGALQNLLAVEKAGGGEKRKEALVLLAARLEEKGGTAGYAVAKFVYAFALECVHLLDTQLNKDKKAREDAVRDLNAGKHPVRKDGLTAKELIWWTRYKAITGEDNVILPGKEGWAEIGDFAKNLLAMATMMFISGGVAGIIGGSVGLGTFGTVLLEVALFTEMMRFTHEMQHGESPKTGFMEDFAVNLAMMGAAKLATAPFQRALFNPATAGLQRAALTAGAFAAEYAAISAVGLAHMAGRAALTGKELSAEEVKRFMLHNFAFLAAFKGAAVLGHAATRQIEKSGSAEVMKKLKELDVEITNKAQEVKVAKDSQEQIGKLDEQAALIERKAALLDSLNNAGAAELAAQYRSAVALYRSDVARSQLMVAVRARPVEGTPNFTYERSGFSETQLPKHFAENGIAFTVERGLNGPIFECHMGGGKVRFEPRDAVEGMGTSRGTYHPEGRIESTRLESGKDVVRILKASSATSELIQHSGPSSMTIEAAGVKCQVTIHVVDAYTVKAPHDAGPAAAEPRYDGKGGFTARLEVLRNTSDQQIVRAVNHEARELSIQISRAVEEAGGVGSKLDRYKDQKVLDSLIAKEAKESALKPTKPGEATAHDIATLDELATLGKQLKQLVKDLEAFRVTPGRQKELGAQRELLVNDLTLYWEKLKFPEDRAGLDKKIKALEKAGVQLDAREIDFLKTMRARHGDLAAVAPKITEVELQILFNELQKANNKMVKDASYTDFLGYFSQANLDAANKVAKASYAKNKDRARALRDGMDELKKLAAGTSTSSLRGRFYEGLRKDEFNADPKAVQEYGRLYTFEKNNFERWDGVCVKGAEVVEIRELPGKKVEIVGPKGKILFSQTGVAGKPYVAKGIEIRLVSMKAKNKHSIDEMSDALGTAKKPTGHELFVSKEYGEALESSIKFYEAKVARLEAEAKTDKSKKGELATAREDLRNRKFWSDHLNVSKHENVALDTIIETLKAGGLDVKALGKNLIVK